MKTTHIMKHTILALLLAGIGLISPDVRADYASYISGTSPVGWWGMNETGATNLTTTFDLSGAYGAAHNQAGSNIFVFTGAQVSRPKLISRASSTTRETGQPCSWAAPSPQLHWVAVPPDTVMQK